MLLTITTTGKVTLLIVAGLFIAWALITAIWIPKRNPDFPATLTVFLLVSSLFLVAQLGAVYWVTSTQEVETEAAEPPGREHDAGRDDTAETNPGESTARRRRRRGRRQGSLRVGRLRRVPHARRCRSDRERSARTSTRPSRRPSLVVTRVTNGMGAMPPFKGQLSEKQIQDVAAYVSSVAGKS